MPWTKERLEEVARSVWGNGAHVDDDRAGMRPGKYAVRT